VSILSQWSFQLTRIQKVPDVNKDSIPITFSPLHLSSCWWQRLINATVSIQIYFTMMVDAYDWGMMSDTVRDYWLTVETFCTPWNSNIMKF